MYLHDSFSLPQFIECGYVEAIHSKQLIGAHNINEAMTVCQRTALHIAIISNQVKVAHYLMNFQPDYKVKDVLGLTPIDYLCLKSHSEQAKFTELIKSIPYSIVEKVNFQKNEKVDLWRSAEVCLERLKELCAKGNPFLTDKECKRTALHWAAISGNVETFKFLLEQKKLNPWAEDIFGFNVYHYLACNQQNPVCKVLQFQFDYYRHQNQSILKGEFPQVIIIGSGAAGIGAAVTLARRGISFTILEARDRIGGRLLSTKIDGSQQDLGACWVHSYTKSNPICKEVKNIGWRPKKGEFRGDSDFRSEICGSQFSQKDLGQCQCYVENFFNSVNYFAKHSAVDVSIAEAGREYYEKFIAPLPKYKKALVDMMINMTEHYEASPIEQLSAKHYEEQAEHGGNFSPEGSYYSLMMGIAKSVNLSEKVMFNREVKSITYHPQNICTVVCTNGQIFRARRVISSLPLGILKQNYVKFDPPLPEPHFGIIKKLGYGLMNKVIVSFDKPFWKGNPAWIRLACEEKGKFPAIINFSTQNKHILCCFVTDNFAKKIEKQADEEILDSLMKLFCRTYNLQHLKPRDYAITRWGRQRYSLGSYSHFDVDSGLQDTKKLRKNISDRLWIVGEHCYGEHIGCAHGAYQTGLWAAQEIIQNLKNNNFKK